MKEDYFRIKQLIDKNENFYKRKIILKKEYVQNSMTLADRLDVILDENQRISISKFLADELSIVKFNLTMSILRTTPN
ncbi:hypothetical protein [Chryseobacterium sp.]|uniref:hypothetical protein n=1 Tax=Chryseobacterium sp. TaxID=1871047 RepID=UPI00289C15A5|nr:hypothetical protein [Chryseobacterium sp.]